MKRYTLLSAVSGCASTQGYSFVNGEPCSGISTASPTPTVSSIGPAMIRIGDIVTVSGSNFNANSFVYVDSNSDNMYETVYPTTLRTTSLSFPLPVHATVGIHPLYVTQNGSGYAPQSNTMTFSILPPDAGPALCSFMLLGSPIVSVGERSSWTVTSTPVGLKGYLYGTKNGIVDHKGNFFTNMTNFVYTYVYEPWEAGTYTRYYILKDASDNVMCTTNPLTITVK